MRLWATLLAGALLAGCASFDGRTLQPGKSTAEDVTALMGAPGMARKRPNGDTLLYFPRHPWGRKTYVATLGPDGLLRGIEQRVTSENIYGIRAGMRKDEVEDLLGPPREAPHCAPAFLEHSKEAAADVPAGAREQDLHVHPVSNQLSDPDSRMVARWLHPAALRALPEDRLVQTGRTDQAVDHGNQWGDLAEGEAEERRDEVEARDGHQSPVQRADDDEHGRNDIDVFHHYLLI